MMRQTEVDGIPTLIAPTAGPTRAGLVFRVGRADETLARGGITHLIEHLALYHLNVSDYHFNGATGATITSFFLQGSGEDITAFLGGVCEALSALPMGRLEMEKEILRTEAANKGRSVADQMPMWRHGARTYGLSSYPEWGLPMLGGGELQAWSALQFTRENAVLWIAGADVPSGLRLALPTGVRQPLPAPTSALPVTPAYFNGPERAIAMDAVIRRNVAGAAYAAVLERVLYRTLRQEGGLSYTATTAYEPIDTDLALLVALADSRADTQDAALGAFIDVLAQMRVGRIEQSDVDTMTARQLEALDHPEVHAARLPGAAFNLLVGHPNLEIDELREEVRGVTVEAVAAVAREAANSALLMVPSGHRADSAGFIPAPDRSAHAVIGVHHQSRVDATESIIIGADGVSLVRGDSPQSTVRYRECAALLGWPDGGRILIGHDGMTLTIEPHVYGVLPQTVAAVDASVPPDLKAALPPRDPSDIPPPGLGTPGATFGAAPGAGAGKKPGGGELAMMIILIVATVGFICLAGLFTLGASADDDDGGGGGVGWALAGCTWVIPLALLIPTIWLIRRRARS